MRPIKTWIAAAALASILQGVAASQLTTRSSLSSLGLQGRGDSWGASLSADGRFVAFESGANDLVPGDTNGQDIFVRDRWLGTTERVNVSSSGEQAVGYSIRTTLSADGRFVGFASDAENLAPGDTNLQRDVFVRDRQTGTTRLVSISSSGIPANYGSDLPAISADGRFITFSSSATNLSPADTNPYWDVFVHDLQTGETSLVSDSPSVFHISEFSAISSDGRFVAFFSNASQLAPGDTNGTYDVFVFDRVSDVTTRVSVSSTGAQANAGSYSPSLSDDGRFVAFYSNSSNLVPGDTFVQDVYVHDRQTGATARVSVDSADAAADDWSELWGPRSISGDGRYVTFFSHASNLAPGDTNDDADVFVHDCQSGATTRVSVDSAGLESEPYSGSGTISGDGRFVAFASQSTNLVPGDTNQAWDVFVHDRAPLQCPEVALYCVSSPSSHGCLPRVFASGACSASASSGFLIQADAIVPHKPGIFCYSTAGAASVNLPSGTFCLQSPFVRTPVQHSGGSAPCSGTFGIDFNAYIASGADPALVAGAQFWGQYWYRDPASASTTKLTHAMTTVICP